MGPDLPVIPVREYTAMAIMCAFALSCIGIMILAARVALGRGLAAFNGIRNSIEALTDATVENTSALEQHRIESKASFEQHRLEAQGQFDRLLGEIKDNGRRRSQ